MAIRSLKTASISTGTKRSKFWDQSAQLALPGSYYSIATITNTSNVQTITFNNIPQDYQHLELRVLGRDTYPNTYPGVYANFNGTGSGTFHYMYGGGGNDAGGIGGAVSSYIGNSAGGDTDSRNFITSIFRIPNYTDSTSMKMATHWFGNANNTYSNTIAYWTWSSGSTAPVTSILLGEGDTNLKLASGSTYALYGIKGS